MFPINQNYNYYFSHGGQRMRRIFLKEYTFTQFCFYTIDTFLKSMCKNIVLYCIYEKIKDLSGT